MDIYINMYMYICTYTCINIYSYMYVHIRIIYVHMHIFIFIYIQLTMCIIPCASYTAYHVYNLWLLLLVFAIAEYFNTPTQIQWRIHVHVFKHTHMHTLHIPTRVDTHTQARIHTYVRTQTGHTAVSNPSPPTTKPPNNVSIPAAVCPLKCSCLHRSALPS